MVPSGRAAGPGSLCRCPPCLRSWTCLMLLETLRTHLLQQLPEVTAHDDYDPGPAPPGFGAVKASVLLPVVQREEPMLLFTRRTETLARHSGQVSFPGGRSEDGDLSPVE